MSDSKYKDRQYLSQYDLDVELFERFNLKVLDVIPVRKIYIIITDKGNKVLKRIDYSIEELKNIYEGIKYIKNSFDRVIDFMETKEGEIYCKWQEDIYCVMDLVQGRECEYSNPVDIVIASKGIAELHKASEGYRPLIAEKNVCGNTIESFERRLEEMAFFKSIALLCKIKTKFDEIFLKNYDYYENKIKESISILKKSQFYKICSQEDKVVLCHHDLANHNILINNEKAYFVDFDYSIVDLRVHDLCNFISKAIKEYAYDIDRAKTIIMEYGKINSVEKDELTILYGMLTFPQDFFSISRDYYTRRKLWTEDTFISRLERKVSYKADYEEFLREFRACIS